MPLRFKLQFPASEIRALGARYQYRDDEGALAAGKRIASGDLSVANLNQIVAWKSARSKGRAAQNDPGDVRDALRLAVSAGTERAALAVLVGLRGVQVPVASAIMTAIDPERFTIIDYRALEALGVPKAIPTIEFYLVYLTECRRIAQANRVTLRQLDRALWQWSRERDQ